MSKTMSSHESFSGFLSKLMSGDTTELPNGELSHAERIKAMSHEGRIVAIDEETWWWFLEVLPPRWMNGNAFAFAEGYDCFRLFWQRGGNFFVRQLSEAETAQFCQLSGVSRSS